MSTVLAPPAPDAGPAAPPAPARAGRYAVPGVLALALALWAVALPSLPDAPLSEYGLLVSGSPAFAASYVVTVAGFALAVRRRDVRGALAATLVLLVVQRLTITLVTDVPPYSWTYKHLGVVDALSSTGHLARGVDVYNSWPGVFAATAWFCDVTGVPAATLAHWFTPGIHLVYVGLTIALARAWRRGRLEAVAVAFVVEALNWVGQDYYSPQACAIGLALGVLVVAGLSRERAVATPVALLATAAIVVSHQLTPYWLVAACGLLMLARRLRPWWLPFAMGALTLAFLATNADVAGHFTLLSFDPVANAQSNIRTTGVFGQVVTSRVVRGLSVGLWLTAAAAAARGLLARRRDPRARDVVAPALVAFSPFLILGGQGYGGEAIFRVFLYALPGCALLVAPWLVRALQARTRWCATGALLLTAAVLASGQGLYGGWFPNRMTREQVTFATQLMARVQPPAYLTVAAPVWPERPTGRYVGFARFRTGYDYPMIYAAGLTGAHFDTQDDYDTFTRTIAARTGGPTYLVISRQMKVYDWYFGILPLDALDNLQARMTDDPNWEVVYSTDAFTVFVTRTWSS